MDKVYYNLFLDDFRKPMSLGTVLSWETVKNYDEFVRKITEKGLPAFISFDHDLATEHYPFMEEDGGISNPTTIPYDSYKEKTGYHCAKWLIDYCIDNKLPLPKWQVHSMNPCGKENIQKLLSSFEKFQKMEGIT